MIDTLNIAKEFQSVGFSQEQSEMMVNQMAHMHEYSEYATKADLKTLGQEMHLELKGVHQQMQILEQRIVFRLGAIVVGATTAMMFFERFLN
jgi:hypothetical protein